jgi:hypothetical protein
MAATALLTLSSNTFQLLGAAPVQVQNLGPGIVSIAVATSLPTAGSGGFSLPNGGAPIVFQVGDASSNVYAALLEGSESVVAFNVVTSET